MDDRHDVSALWQMETRNLIADFAAEADALAAVRQMVAVSGATALADAVLLAVSRDGDAPMRMRTVAAGSDLVRVVQRAGLSAAVVGRVCSFGICRRLPASRIPRHTGRRSPRGGLV